MRDGQSQEEAVENVFKRGFYMAFDLYMGNTTMCDKEPNTCQSLNKPLGFS